MKLAFSNLAWTKDQDDLVAPILRGSGVSAIEIAPGKVWPDPACVPTAEAAAYRQWWEDEGLSIRAMQSLLFGHPEFALFGDSVSRSAMLGYLENILALAQTLGVSVLVFGSPANRRRGEMSVEQAWGTAVTFFRALGERAAAYGTTVCIEANAVEYGCDFVTTTDEAARLVKDVGSPGFGLHLDLGCMELAQENVPSQITKLGAMAKHFHLSSYKLAPIVDRKRADVEKLIQVFSKVQSQAFLSVEMLNPTSDLCVIQSVLDEIAPCFKGG